jgi:hypothetical protein
MPRKTQSSVALPTGEPEPYRPAAFNSREPIAGVPGPSRWLIVEYAPTALFSLKSSLATSSVGKTLLLPTPYSIKMALVDAAFRARLSDDDSAALLRKLAPMEVRVAPPASACVTHTFVKVRQEPKTPNPLHPYIDSIAYREMVHHQGVWRWAFDLAAGDSSLAQNIALLAPHVHYIGKRGSFIQFLGLFRASEIDSSYTIPLDGQEAWVLPPRAHIAELDDFGAEADLSTLSSFTQARPSRGRHRRSVRTIVPIGLVNSGPGFSEYRAK